MAKQAVGIGTTANDGTGDTLRVGADKINDNFDEIYDYLFVKSFVKIGIVFWKKGDENTIDRYGPNGVSKLVKNISSKSIIIQSGFIYHYAFAMLIGLVVLLTWLLMDYGS